MKGYKSVTVPEEAYKMASQLTKLGLEETIGKAFAAAMEEYMVKRDPMIREYLAVKEKWSQKN